jgi:hypothetical protein
MKFFDSSCGLLVAIVFVSCGGSAFAQGSQPGAAGGESCRSILANADGPQTRPRAYCERTAAESRAELEKRGISARGMTDIEAMDRLDREEEARKLAEPRGSDAQSPGEKRAELQEWGVSAQGLSDAAVVDRWEREWEARYVADIRKSRRDSEARTLSELARQDANEQERRQTDDLVRQATSSQEGLIRASEAARVQGEAAARSLGIDLDALDSDDEEESDAAVDAFGMQLYQQMINNGIAPECKGKQGDALIECVDAALDVDEEQ